MSPLTGFSWLRATISLLLISLSLPLSAQLIDPGDSAILRIFYDSLDGPSWSPNNWDFQTPADSWYGIEVDPATGRVTEIIFSDINGNGLRGIVPNAINGLTALEILNLTGSQDDSNDQITALPPNLNGLGNLITLIIGSQDLTSLPSLDPLTQLVRLDITRTSIQSLPSLDKLTALQTFSLLGDSLTSLPSLDSLRSLESFSCSGNQLTQLPVFSDSLYRLRSLICTKNQLTSLPSFEHLVNLEVLIADGNLIPELPNVPFSEKMVRLVVNSNELTEMPDLALFPNLQNLEILNNDIDTLLHLDSLHRMRRLNISDNPLGYTPPFQDLDTLDFLGAVAIGMDALPSLDSLTVLRELHIADNDLTSLPSLDALKRLTRIEAANNQLTTFPSIDSLDRLNWVNVSGNQLYEIPGLAEADSFAIFIANDNLFSDLPDWSAHPTLVNFQVAGNYLDTLTGIDPTIQTGLEDFFVYENQFDDLPYFPTVTDMRSNDNRFDLDDLLPYAGVSPIYAPQGFIPVQRDTLGANLILHPLAGGDANNVYVWTKDGQPIAGADSLIISLPTDSGSYVCTVTHPTLPALTLSTGPVNPCVDINLCDMNRDGVCDIRDLEPLAAQLYAIGLARSCGETPLDWGMLYQGHDLKFLDCNGDGELGKDDTLCLRQYYDAMTVAKFLQSSLGTGLDAAYEDSLFTEISDTLLSTGHRVRFTDTVENVVGVVFVREIIPPAGYTAYNAYHELDSSDFAIRQPDDSVNEDSMLVFTQFFSADTAIRSPEISSPNARIEVGIFRTGGNARTMYPHEAITTCKVLVESPPQKRATTELPLTFITYVMAYLADGTVVPMMEHPDTTTLVYFNPDAISDQLSERPQVRLYPNPLQGGQLFQVENQRPGQALEMEVFAIGGQRVWETSLRPEINGAYPALPWPATGKGLFFVKLFDGQAAWWEKVVVE